jgi:hypothetical protein
MIYFAMKQLFDISHRKILIKKKTDLRGFQNLGGLLALHGSALECDINLAEALWNTARRRRIMITLERFSHPPRE